MSWRNALRDFSKLPERPELDETHQSTVAGVYVIGDLADAPILKAALAQGEAVGRAVALGLPANGRVLVVGAGPAGVAAARAVQAAGRAVLLIERDQPYATLRAFPAGKMIYAEPAGWPTPSAFPMQDGPKEGLIDAWQGALDGIPLRQASLEGLRRAQGRLCAELRVGAEIVLEPADRLILALGKRGAPVRLGLPGEGRAQHRLVEAAAWVGQPVVVVGGGDSAIEAALALDKAGATVRLVHRGDRFERASARNQAALAASTVETLTHAVVVGISDATVEIAQAGQRRSLPAAGLFTLLGSRPPTALLRRLGLRLQGELSPGRAAGLVGFLFFVYAFYCLKQKQPLYPFGPAHPLGFVGDLFKVDLGFRTVDASFWGTLLYSLLIVVFGVLAMRRHPGPEQRRRYLSLMGFQAVFLFGLPELIAPLLIERPWKLYALSVPWPLSLWSLVDAPSWAGGDLGAAVGWLLAGALVSFVAIPLYVKRHGLRFCSYLCGCGGLAETVGDLWRTLSPRGQMARKAEAAGRWILLLALPVTLLLLNDAWGLVAPGALSSTKEFAQRWYGLMVDFGLASVVGVALYPALGNRVWCRFFCPLRAWMEELSKRFSRIAIRSNDRCIGCEQCTVHCQMGIDVMKFAQRRLDLTNQNSACIQCGICVEVCPMQVLTVAQDGAVSLSPTAFGPALPPWERA